MKLRAFAQFVIIAAAAVFFSAITAATASPTIEQATALADKGEFQKARSTITDVLRANHLSLKDRKELEWELDRLSRIRNDYSLTTDALYAKLSKSVKDLKRSEFEKWVDQGWFDGRVIDGTMYYVGTSVSNLFFRHPELASRRTPPKDDSKEQHLRLQLAREITAAAKKEHTPYVMPKHFKLTMTVTLGVDEVPARETVKAWLPIPRKNEFQSGFKLISSSSPPKAIAPETSPIRSLYMEEKQVKGKKTKFEIAYEYTTHGVHFELDPKNVQPIDPSNSELKRFTSEAPHVVFSDKIKKLAHELAGNETNPLLNAKAFYVWIAKNIQYSFAREYSTLTNISDYCFANRYGDCGQEAMLFITLCRVQGIPARWQTGWNIFPNGKDIHDWAEVYIAPYGWMPVDPWAGIHAQRYCTSLTEKEREEMRDFYFGGLDPYRMIANSDHSQPLDPPKLTMRSDDIDFQRGELEWRGGNLYFPRYSYDMQIEELKN